MSIFVVAANHRDRNCVVAGPRHELPRFPDCLGANDYADRFRTQRFGFRTHARCAVSIFSLDRNLKTALNFRPSIGRRALILSGLGVVIAGGGVALLRKLYDAAAFSYDGTQYKGRIVKPITPNDLFYCVTKNVIDPSVDEDLWHLEVNGLVQNSRAYRFQDLEAFTKVEQETTLMCISNGLDAGLMSNAVWKGIALVDLLKAAGPLADAKRVRLYGVDNYTDTIPIEKALEPTTLLALEMNGEDVAGPTRLSDARDRARILRRKACEMADPHRTHRPGRERLLRNAGLGSGLHRANALTDRCARSRIAFFVRPTQRCADSSQGHRIWR